MGRIRKWHTPVRYQPYGRNPYQARGRRVPTVAHTNYTDLADPNYLISLCKQEPDEIALTLQFELQTARREIACCVNNKNLRLARIWLRLISKTMMCHSMPSHLQGIFTMVVDGGLPEFIVNEFLTPDRHETVQYIKDSSEHLISICTRAFELFPERLSTLLGFYELLMTLVSSFHNQQGNCELLNIRTKEIYSSFTALTEIKCSVLRKWIKPCFVCAADTSYEDNKRFTDISIVPMPNRASVLAKRHKNFKGNIIEGQYDSADQYLDIHFRLLREEFMCPLREGLQQYLDSISVNDKRQRNPHIRVYRDVLITAPVFRKEIVFTITFKLTSWMKRINWSHSKRLLHGALVCLSSDNFKTMHFATVVERDPSLLKRGMMRVRFEQGVKSTNWLEEKCYVMIETSGLFEAFRHVLQALQSMKDTIPFEDYILKCRSNIDIPKYLRNKADVKFNLTPLLEKHVCVVDNNLRIYDDSDLTSDRERISRELRPSGKTLATHFARNVDIMDYESWPSCESLNLDESQFQALQTALTRELAIIQGPPGTGKSYIGLQIVKILLKNKHVWQWKEKQVEEKLKWFERIGTQLLKRHDKHFDNAQHASPTAEQSEATDTETTYDSDETVYTENSDNPQEEKDASDPDTQYETIYDPRPILIVCYTNHALDQFLEGILQFYKGDVVRVGSRSKSDLLEKHNLSSVKRNMRWSKTLRESIRNVRNEITELERSVTITAIKADILSRNLIHLHSLTELPLSSTSKLEEAYYRWTIHDEDHCRSQGYTKLLNPSLTVIWLDLFRKTNDTAVDHHRKQTKIRKGKNIQVKNTQHFVTKPHMLYDIAKEGPETVEDIRTGLLEEIHIAYSPENNDRKSEINNEFASYIKAQLESTDIMTEEEVGYYSDDICVLPLEHRWRMYRRFVENRRRELVQDAKADLIKLEKASKKLRELELQKDKSVMKTATIIGMTTSCAAKYHAILNEVKPKIIIIEEAAEVLESHILSCLNASCEQMILIGDHQQLRPKVETYDLVNRYHLDVSLFERLIKNDIHYDCLQRQHRMRPAIADVIRHIYPNLEDAVSLNVYPNIGGIAHNLFCVSHEHAETYDEEQRSYSNEHEARFTVSLANYLIQQGYDASRITVLATYKGQLFLLKRLLKDSNMDHPDLKVAVVDNYQGEENDIVILSLVRSNENARIGFLKKENRICVALSRAKMGMYIIGDIEKLAQSSGLWKDIVSDLKLKSMIGNALPLYCQNHPAEKVYASSCEDFKQVPDGGCTKPCEWRLSCGHVCERQCHIVDSEHEGVVCRKRCIQRCKNGHQCRKRCDEDCGNCWETIHVTLKCGHTNAIPCYTDIDSYICKAMCNKQLECGHICTKPCNESCSPCRITYKASLLRCKHEVEIVCSVPEIPQCKSPCSLTLECGHDCTTACKDIEIDPGTRIVSSCDLGHKPFCQKRCETVLACKHKCSGSCSSCFGKRLHFQCRKRCNCDLACGHACEGMCGECFPCERKCENSCPHRRCINRCKEPCQKCEEPCKWNCVHFRCTKLCGEICNRPRCDARCKKALKCDHACIGLCGEPCPTQCLICDKDFLRNIHIYGTGKNPPCVVQLEECKHIVEYKQMDKYMDTKEEIIRLKRCPVCDKPIRRSKRYGNVVKIILRKIETLKEDAVKAECKDSSATAKTALNFKNIQTCLREIGDYFGTVANDLKDCTFLDTVFLGDRQLHSTEAFPRKQFVLDISLEIIRRFDIAFLKMLETKLGLYNASIEVSACIKSIIRQIQQKRSYDPEIQAVVKEITENIRGECQDVRPAMLNVKVVEIDPATGEANGDEINSAIEDGDHNLTHTGRNQEKCLTETLDEPRIFRLQLYIRKELPYYKCGKSQMDQSRGELSKVLPNGKHGVERKERCTRHPRGEQTELKQLKRKHTEPNALPEKKTKIDKGRSLSHSNDDDDHEEDQGILETLLQRDDDPSAAVQILDDCNGSRNTSQYSKHKRGRMRPDVREREQNSRKQNSCLNTPKRNNTSTDGATLSGSQYIKRSSTHEAERKRKYRNGGNDRKQNPITSNACLNSSKRIKTNDKDGTSKLSSRNKDVPLLIKSEPVVSDKRKKINKQRHKAGIWSNDEDEIEIKETALLHKGNPNPVRDQQDLRVMLNKQRDKIETDISEETVIEIRPGSPYEMPVADIRTVLNNAESKSDDLRKLIEKARKSKECSSSSEEITIDDIQHHKEDLYSTSSAHSENRGKSSKRQKCGDIRKVTSVYKRKDWDRDFTANTSVSHDRGLHDRSSKMAGNERTIIKYDDLFS